jgi:hypothetical protein
VAEIIQITCRRCGERLQHPQQVYCQPCNLVLAYRAMPILLGMVFTGHLANDLAQLFPSEAAAEEAPSGYDDEAVLNWE